MNNYLIAGIRNTSTAFRETRFQLLFRMIPNYFFAFFKIPERVPFPVEIQIEPSAVCNLKCLMCIVSQTVPLSGVTLLEQNKFRELLDELPALRAINLTGIGESLIHRSLEDLIREARSRNIQVSFISNGQLLNPQRAEKILSSGVNTISFSLESGSQELYELIRVGASFTKLKENAKGLIQKIKESKLKTDVVLNVVLLEENIEQPENLLKIIDFAAECGIARITFQNPHDIEAAGMTAYYKDKKAVLEKLIKEVQDYADRQGIITSFPSLEIKEGSCYYPWVYPQLTAAGELLPCCIISQFDDARRIVEKYSFGNVFKDGFAKVWNSPKAKEFRLSLKNKKPNDYCRKCSKYRGIL